MTVMTITTPTTVTPIFDELAARLGLVWDVESTPDETEEPAENEQAADTDDR